MKRLLCALPLAALFFIASADGQTKGKAPAGAATKGDPFVYTVKYEAKNWTTRSFETNSTNQLIGEKARKFAKSLNDLGFDTKIKYSHHYSGALGIWGAITGDIVYHQDVSYRSTKAHKRDFSSRPDALAFQTSLHKLGITANLTSKRIGPKEVWIP